ncbi:ribosome maturation factor RimM [Sediminibacillus dalangtanensis]|uniref:Ribosome maturation factor RimM n=1 Tax=Sediminibacillus dalangtanensis TaxID=2729421 RepID=A0ABX7VS97_9BACI|nr:ribosome maturation factor RimM [Sediminibacillus dalangtanensis]QTM99393.1 ribosome maturation factor RimM [Sediminibacillus dalangtanensis]
MSEEMYNVGKIVNTHGIKGEVKVVRITDFDERFETGSRLYWSDGQGSQIALTVDGHRRHKNFDLLHFSGYDSLNDAEALKNGVLQVREEQLAPLEEGEFYYHEIIGCEVYTTNGEFLGKIKEILSPGANDVWVTSRKGKKDLLIPYIEDIVKTIEVDQKRVTIEPMEGLLDE